MLKSINEPEATRGTMLTPQSINEPLELPVPSIVQIAPNTAVIGGPDLTLSVIGSGFTPVSVITFNGGEEPTTFVSTTELSTVVKPSTATVAGSYPVTVRNGDKESPAASFTFTAPELPPE